MSSLPDYTDLPGDDGILHEAIDRWKSCKEWQSVEDERSREDTKFANADARNAWQWPTKIYNERTSGGEDEGVALTLNNTRVHNDLIINSLSKNRYGIKVKPTGGKSSYRSAKIMQAIIRRIENISQATAAYRKVSEQQVDGGIGYILIETDYVGLSFDQDIFLVASRDPTGVYLDRWIRKSDGSDANFGFVFDLLPRKEFNRKYPKYKDHISATPLQEGFSDWISDKEIMVLKYFRRKMNNDTLVSYKSEDGSLIEKLASEIKSDSGNDIYKALMDDIKEGRVDGRTRKVQDTNVEWFMIAGNKIIERGDWAGKYIPICRCVGRELVIDRTLDRKGHTRPLIDAQRMLNYGASMAVEIVASQPKTPYLAPARSIEGQEQFKTLNINNYPVILYNDIDDEAPEGLQKIDPPIRQPPPTPSEGWIRVMQDAERHQMMISGQFQAQMGENDAQSAASGKAINERQQQGDTATYHFPEHQADMLRYIGVQLLDLIPRIYDTERTLHVIGDKNEKTWIRINPNQQEAVEDLQHAQDDEEAVKIAFNPSIGKYECTSDPGPDFATQRQEAWNAIAIIIQQNKELSAVCADLLFKYGDFPGADELMERLQKEIKANKPYLFDDNIEPRIIQLQEQNKRLVAINAELINKVAESSVKIRGRDEKRDIDAYNAETNRMKAQIEALTKMLLTPQQQAQMQHEIEAMGQQHVYDMIKQANMANVDLEDNQQGNIGNGSWGISG